MLVVLLINTCIDWASRGECSWIMTDLVFTKQYFLSTSTIQLTLFPE